MNYYHILNIAPGASKLEIKQAYRKLAKLYHPDRNPETGNAEQFIKIQRAYNALMNTPEGSYSNNFNHEPRYQYTNHAPTDPDEYAWWVKETLKRQEAAKEKARKNYNPEFAAILKKQRKLAKLLQYLLTSTLLYPLILLVALYLFGKTGAIISFIGLLLSYLGSIVVFFVGRARYLKYERRY